MMMVSDAWSFLVILGIVGCAVSEEKVMKAGCDLKPIGSNNILKGMLEALQEHANTTVKLDVEISEISTTKKFGLRPMDVKDCKASSLVIGKKKADISITKEPIVYVLDPAIIGLFPTNTFNVVGKAIAVTEDSTDPSKLGKLIGCCVMETDQENSAGSLGHSLALVTLPLLVWIISQN